ncbi:phosphoenolpyruvate carboxykinase domain-containing protein, partial [Salmonella enterica subsp. enterica serovar Typhimurium]|uniref:phosphoenolpyruvate carboxykinase domain-containing protein n=1 Tax=Salmonella enterica TaxID=28901 RepID=UPI0020A4DEB5
GENMRVLEWILDRAEGRAGAFETPIGYLPRADDLNLDGLDLDGAALQTLLTFDRDGWRAEFDSLGAYLDEFGARMP